MTPQVSVVLSVFNMADVLHRSITSILNQSFEDFEFIIIDDASTDTSWQILTEYQKLDNRIRLFSLPMNSGLPTALNFGIAHARANVIARMDADDFAFPHRLQTQIEFLNHNPQIAVVGANFFRYYEDVQEEKLVVLPETNEEISRSLSFGNVICHPCIAVRKVIFEKYGYYDETFSRMQDYELWLRWRNKVKFYNIQEPLMRLYSRKYGWEASKKTDQFQLLKYDLRSRLGNITTSPHRLADTIGLINILRLRGIAIASRMLKQFVSTKRM